MLLRDVFMMFLERGNLMWSHRSDPFLQMALGIGLGLVAVVPVWSQALPPVTVSLGVTTMSSGPGSTSGQVMRAIKLKDQNGGDTPLTTNTFGLFIGGDVAVKPHVMVGILVDRVSNETFSESKISDLGITGGDAGQTGAMFTMLARHVMTVTSVRVSYRPVRWFSAGLGPAIYSRSFELAPQELPHLGMASDVVLGWAGGASLKIGRKPPYFLEVMGQYRFAGTLETEATVVPVVQLGGRHLGEITWPSTRLPYSHWMLGIGGGF